VVRSDALSHEEDSMNTVVVYDSQYGNTERIAQVIADALRAAGQARAIRVADADPVALQGVDLLVVGSPTQGWRPTPAVQHFLDQVSAASIRDLAVACFDTRFRKPRWMTGSAAERIARAMRKRGSELLLEPESFFVQGTEGPLESGELGRAADWALLLRRMYESSQAHVVAR
jgi:flavodoxin